MFKDERDVLGVLKSELEFLEKGSYTRSGREPWRYQFFFEDSPTCMNYGSKGESKQCRECILVQAFLPESRGQKIPCRHIPLNAQGETLDSLYRYADQRETEGVVRSWLRTSIARLEEERRSSRDDADRPPASHSR
jgi:hypothetical protein